MNDKDFDFERDQEMIGDGWYDEQDRPDFFELMY